MEQMKIHCGGQSPKDFFHNLKGKDRRNLTEVLTIFRDQGLRHVSIKGSSLIPGKNYNDIDLLAIGDSRDLSKYHGAFTELSKRGLRVMRYTQKESLYVGQRVYERKEADFKGSPIDVSFFEDIQFA